MRNRVGVAAEQAVGQSQLELRGVILGIGGGGLREQLDRAVVLLGVEGFPALLRQIRGLSEHCQQQNPHTTLILLRQVDRETRGYYFRPEDVELGCVGIGIGGLATISNMFGRFRLIRFQGSALGSPSCR